MHVNNESPIPQSFVTSSSSSSNTAINPSQNINDRVGICSQNTLTNTGSPNISQAPKAVELIYEPEIEEVNDPDENANSDIPEDLLDDLLEFNHCESEEGLAELIHDSGLDREKSMEEVDQGLAKVEDHSEVKEQTIQLKSEEGVFVKEKAVKLTHLEYIGLIDKSEVDHLIIKTFKNEKIFENIYYSDGSLLCSNEKNEAKELREKIFVRLELDSSEKPQKKIKHEIHEWFKDKDLNIKESDGSLRKLTDEDIEVLAEALTKEVIHHLNFQLFAIQQALQIQAKSKEEPDNVRSESHVLDSEKKQKNIDFIDFQSNNPSSKLGIKVDRNCLLFILEIHKRNVKRKEQAEKDLQELMDKIYQTVLSFEILKREINGTMIKSDVRKMGINRSDLINNGKLVGMKVRNAFMVLTIPKENSAKNTQLRAPGFHPSRAE